MYVPEQCDICPRKCMINRNSQVGYCLGGNRVKIASTGPHHGEERCLSGTAGSGTVFFTGCNLRCLFCQNHQTRDDKDGYPVSIERLADIFIDLEKKGVHNINLVTPTHYRPWIQESISNAKAKGFGLPVVYNTGGYETVQSIKSLKDDVDIWLFDVKFYDSDISSKLADAKDYFEVALKALLQAFDQVGKPQTDNNGIMQKGIIVRMLVLPGYSDDSIKILKRLSKNFPKDAFVLSLMRQYHPPYGLDLPVKLQRGLTNSEYKKVTDMAQSLGFSNHYFQ